MRREDIDLRKAARDGDAAACLTIARKLFSGADGMARNERLAMAYLMQQINDRSADASMLLAQAAPLQLLMEHQLLQPLLFAAQRGCDRAMFKLGIWLALGTDTRQQGLDWLRRSAQLRACPEADALGDPAAQAALLRQAASSDLGPAEVALQAATDAARRGDMAQASALLRVAAELKAPAHRVADLAWLCIRSDAATGARPALPVPLVEHALCARAAAGDVDAQHALGGALLGLPHGQLPADALVTRRSAPRAAAWLLRAADGGRPRAWLDLARATAARATHLGPEVGRFYLEKAARAGVVEAQALLGREMLGQAQSLEHAEGAMRWLWSAHLADDPQATRLLQTLVVQRPPLSAAREEALVARLTEADRELGLRVALARALHLTRREAMGFHPRRDMREWGLVLAGCSKENPKGRLAPAVTGEMKAQLERAHAFFAAAASPLHDAMLLHRGRMQRRVFALLGVDDSEVFAASIGRSWSHSGHGRHWLARLARDHSGVDPQTGP